MASNNDSNQATTASIREELTRLRQQLQMLREHLRATTKVTEKQEAVVNRIRAQLHASDPTNAELPQTQGWLVQQETLYIEKAKLEEIGKQQHDYMCQVQTMKEKVNKLAAHCQSRKQSDFQVAGKEVSGPDAKYDESAAEELCETQEMDVDEGPATQGLSDQLKQAQAQLRAMTEERNTLWGKNLALAKRSVVLSRELRDIQERSKIFRRQRNILQGRLDILEDQSIDIGVPRNVLEAEARSLRRRQREQLARLKVLEGSDESIERELGTTVDFFQEAILETELQNATNEMEDDTLKNVTSQKQRESIDSVFSDGSDKASSESSNQWSGVKEATPKANDEAVSQGKHTSPALSSVSGCQFEQDMVYGDENSEDLIDWTEGDDDEYQIKYFAVGSVEANNTPDVAIETEDLISPMLAEVSSSPLVNQDYEEQVALARAECNSIKQQRDLTVAELEQTRRELATRTAERNGARQRMQLLDEEIAERETREVQLREELRLAREEDPLADKLFIELHELLTKHEGIEEEHAIAEEKIKWLQQGIHNADQKRGEDLERIKYFETVVGNHNGLVENLKSQIETANAQLIPMTADLNERQLSIQHISAELQTARNNLETARTGSKALEASLAAARERNNVTQAEVRILVENLHISNEQRNSANVEVRSLALENEKANAAGEKANEVAAELRRSLHASNDMAHRLRRISGESTRDLVMVRDQRDSALHDISKLTRDLMTSREELGRLRATIGTLTQESNNARTSLMAITEERDFASKEIANLSEQLREERRRVEEHVHSVRMFRDENDQLLTTQEHLRRQIDDILAALEHNQASVKQSLQFETVETARPAWIDTNLCNLLGDGSQEGDVPQQPSSPTLFVNNTPVSPGFHQPPVPAPELATRKSTRSTRNLVPTYVDPPSPSTPKHNRKRKLGVKGGPAKKK